MTPKQLPFREIHLDFHTSPDISGIGSRFDKAHWQRTLTEARVNSITTFSKCHHGWSYHPTKVGRMHPHLDFDLLRAQYDACKEVGIQVPIYISAGVDNVASHEHPGWRQITEQGSYQGWAVSPLTAGFHNMDFFSPYLDYLCDQIREVVTLYPDCDGIFLDIISQPGVCSTWGIDYMLANGLDPEKPADRGKASEAALELYYRKTTEACQSTRASMPVFHNAGHITRGHRSILKYFSHLELESLPTGGWGYDHFPMSAKYASNLGMDFLGMSGKFHTTWGEFGGFKHPNALRYECAAMIAFNSKCGIGDQLHPNGKLDESTYSNIGVAYREVEAREPWCVGARAVSDIAVLSSEAESPGDRVNAPDEGATRALLEEHFLFDIVDREMSIDRYKLLIFPDDIRIDEGLKQWIDAFVDRGGKLLLTGESGFWKGREEFAFDIGADFSGPSAFSPDYILPAPALRAAFVNTPLVMYFRSQRIRATTGQSLGQIFDPFFNRTYRHFCSHQHTPYRDEPSGFDCGVRRGHVTYLAHPVFSQYRAYGAVAYREYIGNVIRDLLGDAITLTCSLPSTGRVAFNYQSANRRYILHLLYGNTINRGGPVKLSGGTVSTINSSVEVIEELLPLRNIKVTLKNLPAIDRVTLEPGGRELPFDRANARLSFEIDEFTCHQIVALTEQ